MTLLVELLEDRMVLSAGYLPIAQAITNGTENLTNLVQADYQHFLGRKGDPGGVGNWVNQLNSGWTQEQVEASFASSTEYIQAQGSQTGWVKALYQDVLNRTPATQEANGWLSALQRGIRPYDIALSFTASRESETNLIKDYYSTYLGRNASQGEVDYWVGQILGGQLREDVAASFLASQEYYEGHGNTNTGWLKGVYNDVLQGDPTQDELSYWQNIIQTDTFSLAKSIANDDENFTNLVRADYKFFLGRDADASGLAYWVQQIHNGWTQEEVEAQFLGSAEYIQDKGGTQVSWLHGLYKDMLGRDPSDSEVNSWLHTLATGVQYTDIAQGFTTSTERESMVVADYYSAFLNRSPGDTEIKFWVDKIQSGEFREDVIAGFVSSHEYYSTHGDNNEVWLTHVYQDILLRTPTSGELQDGLDALSSQIQ